MSPSITQFFIPYQHIIDQKVSDFLQTLGTSNLEKACSYALTTGGKRYRPTLVLMMAKAIGKQRDVSLAALAIEFFHTASLIADDLPCMDNDDERRNQPTVHKVFGESTALLATYALISYGYEAIAKNAALVPNEQVTIFALENVAYNTGMMGATGGQYLDLFPKIITAEAVEETLRKKTVSLFEISLSLGWLFGGGVIEKLDIVKQAAYHFGMAFQIADDIEDYASDMENHRKMNLACVLGKEKAKQQLKDEISKFISNLKELSVNITEFEQVAYSLLGE